MALPFRICLLALCLVLVPAAAAPAERSAARAALGPVSDPSRLPGSVPLAPVRAHAHAQRYRALSLGQRAVRIASRELGTPYRYGGSGPGGFDCSGLVAYVYGRLGISLPHNAAAQYGFGRPVDAGHLKPGDLLFFHGLGHVGLYIGRGRMIHAPQTGERVEIQSLAVRNGSVEGARRITS
jgi:cell wall-associated NlpC family hydrolase